jgi:hypothetical protein
MSIGTLVGRQNQDGGWPYVHGASWTEPTVYAVLALLAAGETGPAGRGLRWILATRRPDGGWPPRAGIAESTWVTSLVALLPPELLGAGVHARGIEWLLGTTGKETTFSYLLRQWLLGNPRPPEHRFSGWPWIRGASAWVAPTALALLALEKEDRRRPSPEIRERIDSGRRFLLARMCLEGGWNHGSVRAFGYESHPYPETTGMALAALRGVQSPAVERALAVAGRFLAGCHSAEALNWLQLGLLVHARLPAGYCPPARVSLRTLPETSLDLLVTEARKGGDPFWD